MKKISLLVMLFLTIATYSQKNFFENLAEFDGEVFKRFRIQDDEDGFKFIPISGDDVTFTMVKNKFDKGVGLIQQFAESKTDIIWYHKHTDQVDHYARPSKIRIPTSSFFETFVMVDGVMFALRNSTESLDKYDIDYSSAWIPVKSLKADKEAKSSKDAGKKTNEDEGTKKKKKFGSIMKLIDEKAKDYVAAGMGGSVPSALKKYTSGADIREAINGYVAAMRKKQGPLTAQEKKEEAYMKQLLVDDNADIKKVNDEYWASPAGQETIRRMNGGSSSGSGSYYLYNSSDRQIGVCLSNGSKSTVSKGEKYSWYCGNAAYYCENDGPTTMISDGEGVCGQTITIR